MTHTEEFNVKGYTFIPNLVDVESCKQLTAELKRLVDDNQCQRDPQCPKSDAVYGAVAFDSMLEQMLPSIEEATGKKLLPTYSYARLYQPGEVLENHVDREPCEISATITLGFGGEGWDLYTASDAQASEKTYFRMAVGDAVVYKGCEVHHGRDEYQGPWQAQVFLHYVDANGPYTEFIYDKRKCLSHKDSKLVGATENLYWQYTKVFSPDSCAQIIKSAEVVAGEEALIGDDSRPVLDKSIRDVKRTSLPVFRGIGATLTGMGLDANAQAWNFDIRRSNQCDYLRYDVNGHYREHIDTFMLAGQKECRKLTVLVFLNDDFEGGKFYIKVGSEKLYPPQSAGTVVVFPSFLLHGVEPVLSGVRRTIVTWLVGPMFV